MKEEKKLKLISRGKKNIGYLIKQITRVRLELNTEYLVSILGYNEYDNSVDVFFYCGIYNFPLLIKHKDFKGLVKDVRMEIKKLKKTVKNHGKGKE